VIAAGRGIASGVGSASAVGSAYVAAASLIDWATTPTARHSPCDADEVLSSIRVSKRETAVLALEPKFQALSDAILHLIVAGVEKIGPHVENPDFPEDMLQAFARFEQDQRETKRLRENARQERRWSFVEKIALLVIGGLVTLGLKALFFPSP
jgi:hypothetical protein